MKKTGNLVLMIVVFIAFACMASMAFAADLKIDSGGVTGEDGEIIWPAITHEGDTAIHTASGRKVDTKNMVVAFVNKAMGSFWMDSTNAEGSAWAATGAGKWTYFPAKVFDPAAQSIALGDAMATNPDTLVVCPTSGEAVNEAIVPAKTKGTLIIGTEAFDYMDNVDYFLDPFEPHAFAKMHVDEIVKRMGDDITYALYVGRLSTPFQVLWCDLFYDYATEHYPKMKCITERGAWFEHNDNEEIAYENAKQVILANEDIDLLWSSSSGGALGLARAIADLGYTGQIYAGGHSRPSASKLAIDNGTYIFSTIHYPGAWGWAVSEMARKIWAGIPVKSGDDLGIDGYHNIVVIDKHVYGDGWILQDKNTIDDVIAKYPGF